MDKNTLRVIDLTSDQLHDLVIDAVSKVIPASSIEPARTEKFVKATEAARYLKIDVKTLYAKVASGQIVAFRPAHSSMRFTYEELDKFLLSGRSSNDPSIDFITRKSK